MGAEASLDPPHMDNQTYPCVLAHTSTCMVLYVHQPRRDSRTYVLTRPRAHTNIDSFVKFYTDDIVDNEATRYILCSTNPLWTCIALYTKRISSGVHKSEGTVKNKKAQVPTCHIGTTTTTNSAERQRDWTDSVWCVGCILSEFGCVFRIDFRDPHPSCVLLGCALLCGALVQRLLYIYGSL